MNVSTQSTEKLDGIELGARLNRYVPAAAHAGRLLLPFAGLNIPYQALGTSRRINIGTPNDKLRLPKIGADLLVDINRQVSRPTVTFMLHNFREGRRKVPVGRPIALGIYDQVDGRPNMRSDFGSAPYLHESYDELRVVADETDGTCTLSGKIMNEDSYILIAQSTPGIASGQDAYRFGNSCLFAVRDRAGTETARELMPI